MCYVYTVNRSTLSLQGIAGATAACHNPEVISLVLHAIYCTRAHNIPTYYSRTYSSTMHSIYPAQCTQYIILSALCWNKSRIIPELIPAQCTQYICWNKSWNNTRVSIAILKNQEQFQNNQINFGIIDQIYMHGRLAALQIGRQLP